MIDKDYSLIRYDGDGSAVLFTYDFDTAPRFGDSQIVVLLKNKSTGTVITLTQGVEYQLNFYDKKVTFVIPPAAGTQIIVGRNLPYIQDYKFSNLGLSQKETIEAAADYRAMCEQQIKDGIPVLLRGYDGITIGEDLASGQKFLDEKINTETKRATEAEESLKTNILEIENEMSSISNEVDEKLPKADVVLISSQLTDLQKAASAKSVYDFVLDVVSTVPVSGLSIPISLEKESQLPDLSTLVPGKYFYIQDMDITAPERTGRAWVNYTDPNNSSTPLKYYKVFDQYQSMDGVSIIQTGGGAWEVSTQWLNSFLTPLLEGKANINLGNVEKLVQDRIDVIMPDKMDYVIETYVSGENWYRKYKSGWIEQGGFFTSVSTSLNTFPLVTPYANKNLGVFFIVNNGGSSNNHVISVTNLTKTSFMAVKANNSGPAWWHSKGY